MKYLLLVLVHRQLHTQRDSCWILTHTSPHNKRLSDKIYANICSIFKSVFFEEKRKKIKAREPIEVQKLKISKLEMKRDSTTHSMEKRAHRAWKVASIKRIIYETNTQDNMRTTWNGSVWSSREKNSLTLSYSLNSKRISVFEANNE